MTREEMVMEATCRLKQLAVMGQVVNDWRNRQGKKNCLYYSERVHRQFPAVLYWIDNVPEYRKLVDDFEKKYGGVVYHAILTHTEFGDCLDFLYVSSSGDEWEMEREDLRLALPVVYCNNLSDPDMSEFGSIGVRPAMGGVERVA